MHWLNENGVIQQSCNYSKGYSFIEYHLCDFQAISELQNDENESIKYENMKQ